MKIIDLSHPISPGMPVYPGTEPPVFVTGASIAKAGFLEKKITLFSHTGTHVDAPAHLIEGASTLDQLPVEQFIGKALVLGLEDCRGPVIGIKDLERFADAVGNRVCPDSHGLEPLLGNRAVFLLFPGPIPRSSGVAGESRSEGHRVRHHFCGPDGYDRLPGS